MEKKELRKAMKRRNLALCPEARAEASARIFAQVEAMPAFAAARTVALFVSLDDEPDTREALGAGGRRDGWSCRASRARRCGFSATTRRRCVRGRSGFRSRDRRPSRAIRGDRSRGGARHGLYRVGSPVRPGRGYYDRYLAQPGMRAVRIGICYRHQVVEALPVEAHDVCAWTRWFGAERPKRRSATACFTTGYAYYGTGFA